MNQSPKNSLDTVDAVVDDIIAEMPLDDRVRTANLDEDGLLVLQLALGKYLRHLLKNQSEDVNRKLFKACVQRSGNENLDEAGVDKVRRDVIVGHSLKGMDVHYIVLSDESLQEAMDRYTQWLDERIDEANRSLEKAKNESRSNSS